MERFIASEDLQQLEKPLLFEADTQQFKKLLCCQSALLTLGTYGMLVPCMPVKSCAPFTYADSFSLRLDQDAVTYSAATNDCCCHIAKTLKTVPLEKVQDVELQSNCLLSCFGLKAVNVQTAGMGGTMAPEVSAAFLKDPERVREALRLAVKLYRQQQQGGGGGAGGYAAPVQAGGPSGAKSSAGSLMQRLQDLEGLVTRGVLARAEADALKVCVLAAPDESWLSRLGEAADLRDGGLISAAEFEQLKASLVTQLRGAAAA